MKVFLVCIAFSVVLYPGCSAQNLEDGVHMVKRNVLPTSCLSQLYIMAFTSGDANAGSDDGHNVELQLCNETRSMALPNLPGNDYERNKGDLWKLSLSDFGFTDTCIKLPNIKMVSIVSGSTDAWIIDSIVTFVLDGNERAQVLTQDFDVNQLVDDNSGESFTRFELTRVGLQLL